MNHLKLFSILLISLMSSTVLSQSIEATLIDQRTKNPIPFATIILNQKSGVISSEQGKFTFHLPYEVAEKDSIYIRSLGYQEKVISAFNFTESIIELQPEDIILNEVVLLNTNYSADQIMEMVRDNLLVNYQDSYTSQQIFYRDSDINGLRQFNVEVKKSTIAEFNQNFADQIINELPKSFPYHRELLGDLYLKNIATRVEELKLKPIKACELYDKNNEFSSDKLEGKLQGLLQKHIKRNSYFKIKSGLIGTTTDEIDSSFFRQTSDPKVSLKDSMDQIAKSKENFNKSIRSSLVGFLNFNFLDSESDLDVIHKYNKYRFTLDGLTTLDNSLVYKISFEPKRGDYSGKLYINTEDYGIMRIDYHNVKPLKRFNLFGISYRHHLKEGTYLYERNDNGTYSIKFQEEHNSTLFGIDRPLNIIEKNKHVKGRRKQNQVRLGLDFEIQNIQKKTLVVFKKSSITEDVFTKVREDSMIEPAYLPQYDPMFWEGYNILTPNKAITEFKSLP